MSNSKRGKKHYLDEKGKGNKVRAPKHPRILIDTEGSDRFNWKEAVSGIEASKLDELDTDEVHKFFYDS